MCVGLQASRLSIASAFAVYTRKDEAGRHVCRTCGMFHYMPDWKKSQEGKDREGKV